MNESASGSKSRRRRLNLSQECALKLEKEFVMLDQIGSGGFGEVYKAKKKSDKLVYAIKKVVLEDFNRNLREIRSLSELKHPNIVRYYSYWIEPTTLSEKYSGSQTSSSTVNIKALFIQMELCENNTLKTVIDNNSLYSDEEKIQKYFGEICEGLAHIHDKKIAHRDLKPHNIFLTNMDTIKIGDFGLSKRMGHDLFEASLSLPYCGTAWYRAPEINSRNKKFHQVDIYSLGVTYFEMCSEPMTAHEKSRLNPLYKNIDNVQFPGDSSERKDLIKKMIDINCNKRPTCKEIIRTFPLRVNSSAQSRTSASKKEETRSGGPNDAPDDRNAFSADQGVSKKTRKIVRGETSEGSTKNSSADPAVKGITDNTATEDFSDRSQFSDAEEAINCNSNATYINVLLLGETGNGKSTFINAIANYHNYDSFEDAEKAKLLVPIPATIKLCDKDNIQCTISVGIPDTNESQTVGAAATQNVKPYLLKTKNQSILRLIDTPGMGDPEGVDTDDQNCENILSYLSGLETLHAICFLVKTGNTRITVYFEYCFKQILSRLAKSASSNIIFIFTNTRADFYNRGNTYDCLKVVVDNIMKNQPQVNINFDRNLFFMDNEAFRFLAALQNGIKITSAMRTAALESWVQSANECERLITYIQGDDVNPPLQPHKLTDSISINKAQRLIENISKPLADISDLIQDNIRVLTVHEKSLRVESESLDDMKMKMYIPFVDIKVQPLDFPVTTCRSQTCLEYVKIEHTNVPHYKQICHNPCEAKYIPPMTIGSMHLLRCKAINLLGKCKECGCSYRHHMRIYELTSKFENKIENKELVKTIKTMEEAVTATKYWIKNHQDRKNMLEDEQNFIVQSIALFAHFVQKNAITPFNDAYKGYIDYLIIREKARGDNTDQNVIVHLEDMLNRYEENKRDLNAVLKLGGYDSVTPEAIISRIESLYKLSNSGNILRQIMDVTNKCTQEEHKKWWGDQNVFKKARAALNNFAEKVTRKFKGEKKTNLEKESPSK